MSRILRVFVRMVECGGGRLTLLVRRVMEDVLRTRLPSGERMVALSVLIVMCAMMVMVLVMGVVVVVVVVVVTVLLVKD